jgi:hypothetical protein
MRARQDGTGVIAGLVADAVADARETHGDWLSGDVTCADNGETFGDWLDGVRHWEEREGFTSEHVADATDARQNHPRLTRLAVAAWFAEADRIAAADTVTEYAQHQTFPTGQYADGTPWPGWDTPLGWEIPFGSVPQ